MDILKKPVVAILIGVIIGFALGLFWGWYVDPIEWEDVPPDKLGQEYQEIYIRLVAENYTLTGNQQMVMDAFADWPDADAAICAMQASSTNPDEQNRLEGIAAIYNGEGCAAVGETSSGEPAEEGGSNLGAILFLGLLLIILVGAILFVINRRNAAMSEDEPTSSAYGEIPADVAPVMVGDDAEGTAVPIARFRTTYTRGHDAYDDSFSIENASGDFLGECGIGISESIGTDTPKNVTAFEVWLFDKNDIRTITKVVMSDHAFFDEALKAKLATKGEQVLAREAETIVLETASLIINVEVSEMQYGTGTLPPQSYFDSITYDLSAWAKEPDTDSADPEGRVDDLMDY